MKIRNSIVVVFVTALLLAGCQAAKPSALSVDRFLHASQTGDYQSAVRDFSDQMKSVYTEVQFNQLRDLLQRASGSYVYCSNEKPSLSNKQGYAIYYLTCKFEKENVGVTITFKIGGDKIEGLFFNSVNLVNQTK
jgi:hypothetical protein